ncbi:MAG: condensation domain-containing protein, partial [Verrucomicrobiota bacterium]
MLTSNAATGFTRELPRLTIPELLGRWASEMPENIAIIAPGRSPLTYSGLMAQIEESVRRLNEMGLGGPDRIAVVLPNGPEMAVAFLVAGSAATCAPLNPAYRASEFDFYLNDLQAKALIVQAGAESPARTVAHKRGIPIIELSPCAAAEAGLFTLTGNLSLPAKHSGFATPEDVALLLHTSGTTARPKIVPLTHKNLCVSARNIRETLELAPGDCCLNVMPLFHIHGLIGAALSSLAGGASVVCTPGFYAPKFFAWMDQFRPSWYTAVPTMHQAILARAGTNREIIDRAPLRLIRSSSAALPPLVMAELEKVFKAPVIESYGMTEASHQMASNPLPPRLRKPGSVGLAAGPEIAIMGNAGDLLPTQSSGEVVIRGPNVIAGYENNAVANASAFTAGWFRTGDQGYLDTDGYLFINGRLKEIINRGGEKISPREVDEVLLSHPAVAEAATFAIPHTKLGEEIGAAVVLREKSSATERDLREFAAARLADFKVPYRILILDEIPKGPTGKMQRIGLAEKLGLQTINPELQEQRREFTGPRDECESALANIWSEVLGRSQLSVYDNFLELGGDSILGAQVLSRVRRNLRVELPLLVLFEEGSNIAGLAKAIQRVTLQGETSAAIGILPGQEGRELPLSFGQERLWFLSQFEPENPAYNRPAALRLAGPLEVSTLERSLSEIIRRHEVLRSTISAVDGQPVQRVSPARPVRLSAVDLRRVPAGQREIQLGCLIVAEAQAPFNLEKGPLLRLALYRVADEEHVLLLTAHHLVFDGWSMEVFTRELTVLYEAFSAGKPAPLAELSIQYSDFAHWQREWMQPERLHQHLAYWKRQLHDAPAELPFPTDRPRLPVPTYRGGREKVSLSRSLVESMQNLSQGEGTTLFMTLLAAWQTLLFRYTQQSDISIGTAIAGRNQKETEALIGFFVNLLVLRIDLSGDPTFRSLLKRVRAMALGAYAHQDLPFEKLVEAVQPKRDFNRTPLFQVMFVLKRATPP